MQLRRIALGIALLAAPGCAAFRQLARPDPEPQAPSAPPWTVACIWVEPGVGPEAPLGPREHGRLWALDPNGRRIAVEGGLEDGFLRVDGLAAWTPERGAEPLGVDSSPRAVQFACRETLAGAFPGRALVVDRIAAAREGEDVDVPLAFAPGSDGAPAGTAKRLVVFGDSLSDPGNLKRRLKVFPDAPYYLGRFSNGPNWAQYLSERSALPVYNHAVGGSISVPHDDIPSTSILSAVQQGAQYLLTGSLNEYVGDYLAKDLQDGQLQRTNDTVFVLWSGGNDYLSKEPLTGEIDTLLDSPRDPSGYVRVVEQTTRAIAEQVRRLHAAGGRRFVVLNLPDLGKIPGVLHNTSYRASGSIGDAQRLAQLSRRMSELSRYHNVELAKQVEALRAELPGTAIVLVDARQAVSAITDRRLPGANGGRAARFDYGFDLRSLRSEAVRDRRGPIAIQDRCYRGGYLGTSDPANVCPEESAALFWDSVHPTSFTHCWVAFFVERGLAQSGLLASEPNPDEFRDYCAARQELPPPLVGAAQISGP